MNKLPGNNSLIHLCLPLTQIKLDVSSSVPVDESENPCSSKSQDAQIQQSATFIKASNVKHSFQYHLTDIMFLKTISCDIWSCGVPDDAFVRLLLNHPIISLAIIIVHCRWRVTSKENVLTNWWHAHTQFPSKLQWYTCKWSVSHFYSLFRPKRCRACVRRQVHKSTFCVHLFCPLDFLNRNLYFREASTTLVFHFKMV